MTEAICISESSYHNALTRGKFYSILEKDEQKRQVRIIDDNGRKRWFPSHCFDYEKQSLPILKRFTIDDEIEQPDKGAIEVTLEFTNGERRWCLFITPSAFADGGDNIAETDVSFHYDLKHLIVVDVLNADAIEKILQYIDGQGLLIQCSLPLV